MVIVQRLLCILLALMLVSCVQPTQPLRVGTNVWAGYELLYLARERGLYDENVKLVELSSASDVMEALRRGDLEAGGLTLDETMTLIEEGIDLVVVLVFDVSAGADVVMASPEVKDLSDLRGRRIAVETTALGALMLEALLAKSGLTIDDVRVRHLALREHLDAYRRGEIDASITFAPYDSALAAEGAIRRFDSREIPGKILDVLVIRRDVLEQQDPQIRQLVDGYFQARRLLETHPAASLEIINRRLKLPESELAHAYDGIHLPSAHDMRTMLSGDPSPLQTTAQSLTRLMRTRNLLPGDPILDRLTTAEYLPEDP